MRRRPVSTLRGGPAPASAAPPRRRQPTAPEKIEAAEREAREAWQSARLALWAELCRLDTMFERLMEYRPLRSTAARRRDARLGALVEWTSHLRADDATSEQYGGGSRNNITHS